MSADDQRAAEERVLELCDMDYERAAATCAEFDRLRAELAETRAELDSFAQLQREYAELINRLVPAGDALAAAADVVIAGGVEWMQAEGTLIRHREEWWSVRGDAPTAGGLLPDKRIRINLTPPSRAIPAAERRNLAAELRSRFVDGPVDEWSAGWLSAAGYIGSDSPIGVDPGTDLTASTVEPAEPSAVGLPVTLSSVDDVAAVCRAHGLAPFDASPWEEGGAWETAGILVEARDDQTWHITLDGRHGADLDYGYPAAALVAAIEAARGGAR